MKLTSTVDIDAPPERIFPLFLNARMDDRVPLAFRLGLPKAVSCSIIEGNGEVGSIRRCVTTRGVIDQVIEGTEPNRRLAYRLIDSDYWGQPFVSHVADEITLEPLSSGRTRVRRVTSFDAKGILKWPGRWIMRLGFRQAHRYANENWRRIASA